MNFKTVAQATADLEALAKQLGADRFEAGKKAYLGNNIVTDDAGSPLSDVTIDVHVEKSAPVAESKNMDQLGHLRQAIREEIASAIPAVSKSVRIESGTPSRPGLKLGRTQHLKSAEQAYRFGRYLQAITFGDRAQGAVKFCRENGIDLRYGDWKSDDSGVFVEKSITGHSEAVNADGGFLVPLEFDPNNMVWLREQYGVFRQYAEVRNMSSDRHEWLRKNSSHTAYPVGEGNTNTTSKMAFTRLGLTARKWRVDGYLTKELGDDAAVMFGDLAANDIREVFNLTEDNCGFNGDGTSTYNGIMGLTRKFLALGTVSNSIGIYDTAGTTNTYETITLPQIQAWRAKLPAFADNPRTRIFCHKLFYHTVLERLAANAGGSTLVDIGSGMSTPQFMGTPVVFCQALPSTPTADVPDAFYGDLYQCASFGSRMGMTLETTAVGGNAWENDEIAYKAVTRFDINVHDVGNNTATAADRKAGPVVALIVT